MENLRESGSLVDGIIKSQKSPKTSHRGSLPEDRKSGPLNSEQLQEQFERQQDADTFDPQERGTVEQGSAFVDFLMKLEYETLAEKGKLKNMPNVDLNFERRVLFER